MACKMVVLCHVTLDISRAMNLLANKAQPILALILAVLALQFQCRRLERNQEVEDILGQLLIDVWAISFWLNCEAG